MPSFSAPSSIRVASQDHVLRLKVTHNLVHGSPSDAGHRVKGRLPKELDVLWLSDIAISFSGSFDGRAVLPHDIARSGLVRHLRTQLKANADQLGLNNISRPFVDADGHAKLTLTPSRPLPHASRPYANLVSLHLAYIWKTAAGPSDIDSGSLVEVEVDPFSPTLFLPTEALLNRVTEQFLIYHVVGRYPLIFGPWCKRLDLEMQYFPSIGNSIVKIMGRSKNEWFLSKCKRLLKIARSQHKCVIQTSTAALSSCTASDTSEEEIHAPSETSVLTDEQVLCESLEQLFRVGVSQRRFKPAATPQFVTLPQEEDSLLPSIPDEGVENEVGWSELSGIAMSPCILLPDSPQALLEDMDIFTEADGPEDEMWDCDEASRGQDKSDNQWNEWDESLIGASIGTDSQPACGFAHQQQQDPAVVGVCYSVSQLAFLEDPGLPNLTHLVSHAHQNSVHNEQLTQNPWACQVDLEGFELLEDSEWILFEEVPEDAEVTEVLV